MSRLATAFVWCSKRPHQPRSVCCPRLPLQQLQLLQTQLWRGQRQRPQQTHRRQHPPTASKGSLGSLGIPRQQRRLTGCGPRQRQQPLQQPLPHLVMLPQLRCHRLQRQVRQIPTNSPCIVVHIPAHVRRCYKKCAKATALPLPTGVVDGKEAAKPDAPQRVSRRIQSRREAQVMSTC